MRISEHNLKSTCGFIVSKYRRGAAADKTGTLYIQCHGHLAGLSFLLIGFKEKLHIDDAIKELEKVRADVKKTKAESAAA
ncbi:hypothetical protein JWZ98_03320 [Methylomonas sp. EFPC1]|uniref:hypothetical protein n=1 Tax=Methylomonas sp. EFPC1 TaxID=2812647 RepID=UPI0019683D1F|nr:hypothetical protein [Methylomonas sp. EFPC1]QSB02006.1 hypothetical protein JWZ98_03320 [Methylomonas sp. EFPC1]